MRKKKKRHGGVELNMAAMLDMAFQLLTFFILTFRPAPIEGEVRLRLPPPMPVTGQGKTAGGEVSNDPVQGLNTLVITAFSKNQGELGQLAIGDTPIGGVAGLDRRLAELLADPGSPFEQIIVQVGSKLSYEGLMQVVDVCTRQKLANGEPLTKLSFVEALEE